MINHNFDVVILGDGPVGQILALLLAKISQNPQLIALIKNPLSKSKFSFKSKSIIDDSRVLALNYGSLALLESLNIELKYFCEIKHIHISQYNKFGRCIINSEDFGLSNLGNVVTYNHLCSILEKSIAKCGVTILNQSSEKYFTQQNIDAFYVKLKDLNISSRIGIKCDGTISDGMNTLKNNQYALVTIIKADLPCNYYAWERFTSNGPLALLPFPQRQGVYSVIWCGTFDNIKYLHELDRKHFSEILNKTFGYRLGRFECEENKQMIPLISNVCQNLVLDRLVIIGNSAQILHPVAGQGLNLGFRDAGCLSECLKDWFRNVESNPLPLLQSFKQSRNLDRKLTINITNFLPYIFSTKLFPIEYACGMALMMLDLIPSLRKIFLKHFLVGFRY
ncbi:MAG: FAD-dependent monooxygenase [Bordetella sp.]|nr:MAG: FAD-dependent monooxygenase [Bordetella sp.]